MDSGTRSTTIAKPDGPYDLARKYVAPTVAIVALAYALFAGLRTVGDMDLGWQMATGRWIVQHGAIPSTDVLSFTGTGQPWIYPALSQVLFYLLYMAGGYALLSWVGAAACVASTALLLRRETITNCLALISVPLIAGRTAPRAELFSTLFFALFVSVLWRYHRSGRGRLWLLPLAMFLWVNLHLGFVSGLGMCGAYVLLELEEAARIERRAAALERLRAALPWLAATFGATLLNPWGVANYAGMMKLMPTQSNHWVEELLPVRLTPRIVEQAIAWRDPRSAVWWLIVAVMVALLFSVYRRRFVPAVIFAASIYLVLHVKRFDGPFATIAVVMGGAMLTEFAELVAKHRAAQKAPAANHLLAAWALWAGVAVLAAFAGVRVTDLISNRTYLRVPFQFSIFGAGEASWYPEDAAAFLKREKLPGNVFSGYNVGGFVAWRLLPEYADYIDGRGNPFGLELFLRSLELSALPLDSAEWRQEADARGINTVLVSLDPDIGTGLAHLDDFCGSQGWRPVYLDVHGALFVRVRPETADLTERLQLNCADVRFDSPPAGRAEQFLYERNAAAILIVLGRNGEALQKLNMANAIFSGSSQVHYLKGLALLYTFHPREAEEELLRSLEIEPYDQTSLALERLYKEQRQLDKAEAVLRDAADRSDRPAGLYLELGLVQVSSGAPERALESFELAEKNNPFNDDGKLARGFKERLAQGREAARAMMQPGNQR